MSQGVAVPSVWPQAIADSGVGNYPCIIIDEGNYVNRDFDLGLKSEASLIIRVEGLPDTTCAISIATDAAIAAYPSHPCESCLQLNSAGPLFGHQHLKMNSMVVGRGMTTDEGFTTDAGLKTRKTGTIVLVKLLYQRKSETTTI